MDLLTFKQFSTTFLFIALKLLNKKNIPLFVYGKYIIIHTISYLIYIVNFN